MDSVTQFLFNPNHEMPSGWIIAVIFAVSVVVPTLMRYIQGKREDKRKNSSSDKKK